MNTEKVNETKPSKPPETPKNILRSERVRRKVDKIVASTAKPRKPRNNSVKASVPPMKCLPGLVDRIIVKPRFIEKNNLTFLRTPEEIVAYLKKRDDFLGFQKEVLLHFLSFEDARSFLTEEFIKKIESGEEKYPPNIPFEEAVQDFVDYLNFAWMKAIDCRSLSASRSIEKLGAWLWLFGREDLNKILNNGAKYNPYGAPALVEVSRELGIEPPAEFVNFSLRPL